MIGVPIVVFWLIMMGLLLRSEFGVRKLSVASDVVVSLTETTESWLNVTLAEGQKVGRIHLLQIPEERRELRGATMALDARMNLNLMSKPTELEVVGSIWRSLQPGMIEFDFTVRSAGFDFAVDGEITGGELRGEIATAGEKLPIQLPIDDSVIFSTGVGQAMQFPRLEVGDEVFLDSFDPLTLTKSRARVRCTHQEILHLDDGEVETRRLVVTTNGLSSVAWIDEAGEVVRAQTPIGLTFERTTAEAAGAEAVIAESVVAETAGVDQTVAEIVDPSGQAAESLAVPEFLDRTSIEPTGLKPFRSAKAMTVRLTGFDIDSEPLGPGPSGSGLGRVLPTDTVQTALGDDRYRLSMPLDPGSREPQRGPSVALASILAKSLAADAFVQSDHPKIRQQADAIVGRISEPWDKALAIHDWVFARLDKEAVLSIPSALEVLERRRGDCNEHTVLFTALARAVEVPTRIAIGLVWSDELAGFYYHAWPEVFVGEWVWMDPTLDQPVADATHIKLLNGGIESWPRLLPFLGRLGITVLEIE